MDPKLKAMIACPKPVKIKKPKWLKRKKPKKNLGLKESRIKELKAACLDLWFAVIHRIYNETCAACGRQGKCSGHHFFGQKAYPSVVLDVENGVLLCTGCHIMKVHRKGQTEIARDALITRIGQERFDRLKERANQVRKFTESDLIALKEELLIMLAD